MSPRLAPDCYDLKNPPTRSLPMGEELEKHRNGIEFQFHGQSRREVSFRAAARTSNSPRNWRSPGKRTWPLVTRPGNPARMFATRVTKETVLPLLIEMCVFISLPIKRKHAAPLGRESYIAVTLHRNEPRHRKPRHSNRGSKPITPQAPDASFRGLISNTSTTEINATPANKPKLTFSGTL